MRNVGLAIALVALALACRVETPAPAGEVAPDFVLKRLDGSEVSLADLRGKTLLVDFWATWCPPCILEIPELNAFYAAHKGDGVELLAIAVDVDDPDELAAWTQERDVQYPVAIGDMDVAQRYGADLFPFHLLISPEGRVVERLTPGYHDRDELAELVARHAQ